MALYDLGKAYTKAQVKVTTNAAWVQIVTIKLIGPGTSYPVGPISGPGENNVIYNQSHTTLFEKIDITIQHIAPGQNPSDNLLATPTKQSGYFKISSEDGFNNDYDDCIVELFMV